MSIHFAHLTLPEWNLLINALMTALMVVYAFWIRHVVGQQRKSKDAAIQALQATLTVKEAEISRLTQNIALNIVKADGEMREHADKMTAEVMVLQNKIQGQAKSTEFIQLLSEFSGLMRGYDILEEKLGPFMGPMEVQPSPLELWHSISETAHAISQEISTRIKSLQELAEPASGHQ
jgi:hypothetical protein